MNFRPELADAVMAGRKTVTRRLVRDNPRSPWWRERCSLNIGQDYAVCPGRGKNAIGRVRISSLTQQTLGEAFGGFGDLHSGPQNREAMREGFRNAVSFQLAWLQINGGYDEDALVWRVGFELQPSAFRRRQQS